MLKSKTETIPLPKHLLRAIDDCRKGNWRDGLETLSQAANIQAHKGIYPGIFYSYLGAGLARLKNRKDDGLSLCQYAVKKQRREPDNYWNLASVYLSMGDREQASKALFRGLAYSPNHEALLELQETMGVRRPPILSFIPRGHALNRKLGQLVHTIEQRILYRFFE